MGGITPLPPGFTVDGVVDTLRFVVGRHQSLRTRLRLTGGRPRQSCETSGEVPLHVVEAGGADPAELAEHIQERYQSVPFDYEREWPVRTAVVLSGGAVTHMVATYLHLAMDAGGMEALIADMFSRDPVTGDAAPVTALQPLEQARQQQESPALRKSAASLRYLEQVLRAASPSRFGPPREDRPATYRLIRYRSPATLLAVDAVGRRTGAGTSPVLLAAFAVGLARFTGNSPVMAMLMVSNRFRPGFGDSVSTVVQLSPYLIDVADTTLAEAVARAGRSTMNAYKHAYYDPYLQDEVLERVNVERGEPVDYSCFYNDRRKADRSAPEGPDPTAEELSAALARSEVHWEDEPGMPRQKLYLHVDGPPGAIDFVMSVDTRYFTEEDTVAVVRAMEAAAVQMALEPGAPTGVRAAEMAGESLAPGPVQSFSP